MTRIAIVGASGRAAAASALRAGLTPMAADLFADADLARLCPASRVDDYPRGFAAWLASCECDAWLYVGGLENFPRLIDRMARSRRLLGNGGTTLRRVRSPRRLAAAISASGFGFPETCRDRLGFSDPHWIRKPWRGSGGAMVRSADAASTFAGRCILQKKIAGASAAALYIADGKSSVTLGVTEQLVGLDWTGAGPYQYCGSIGLWQTTSSQKNQIDAIGQALAQAFGIVGLFGVDLAIDEAQVWTIEVNPRYTAAVEVVERALATPLLGWHVAACERGAIPAVPEAVSGLSAGKAILYARSPLYVNERASATLMERAGVEGQSSLADIPPPDTRIQPGQPVLTLLATGGCRRTTKARFQMLAEEIRAELGDLPSLSSARGMPI